MTNYPIPAQWHQKSFFKKKKKKKKKKYTKNPSKKYPFLTKIKKIKKKSKPKL